MERLGSPAFSSCEDDGASSPSDYFTLSPRTTSKGRKKKRSGGGAEHSKKSSGLAGRRRGPPKIMAKKNKRTDFSKLTEMRHNKTFRKIEQDIKQRQKRQKKEREEYDAGSTQEETYVDKDRAIVVNIGQGDLKGHIMKHRGRLHNENRTYDDHDIAILIEQAEHEMKFGDAQKALAYLEKGIEIRPENIDCLVLKSRCLVDLNRFREALSDVDTILEELGDKHNSRALTVRGDALYNLGNFEHALINYHRAKKYAKFKEKGGIFERIGRTELAVSNAVGPSAAHYFKHLDKFLYKIPSNIMGLPIFSLLNKTESGNTECTRFKDKKFLGDLAPDKSYLESILEKLSFQTTLETAAKRKVKKEAENALNYLIERREFWAQQNPDYPELTPEMFEEDKKSWRSSMKKTNKRRTFESDSKMEKVEANPYG